ncbi:transport and Golgi organization 2 homolog [Clytia hemisphaerica]|uniref:transport and Golgi organization 2 homolog n=1 Tax=Clytia hemisphaerica TaxID=252671 RepID=UPI0034D6F687
MCIVFLWRRNASQPKGRIKFVLAGNRDEFFHRPAKDADYWDENSNVLGGRDMTEGVSGGTWMGVNKHGKIGFLTNIRGSTFGVDPAKANMKGRGALVSDFLLSELSAEAYIKQLENERMRYKPFNLVCGDVLNDQYFYSNSVDQQPAQLLTQDSISLSNGTLGCGWFKVDRSREKFEKLVNENVDSEPTALLEKLQTFLKCTERNFPDENIKVENPFNEVLSSIFIPMHPQHNYGTRTNTMMVVEENNRATFLERTMCQANDPTSQWKKSLFQFDMMVN